MKRCVILSMLAITCVIGGPAIRAQAGWIGSRGGSNYIYYQSATSQQPLECFGVVKNYHLQTALIRTQLQDMKNSGQMRLRIPLYFRTDEASPASCANVGALGLAMPSAGGNFAAQYRQNLANLLVDIKDRGFAEVEISFHPLANNSPEEPYWPGYPNWNEGQYQENWNLIYNLHSVIQGAGIQFKIDLSNELSPTGWSGLAPQYLVRLWSDYNYVFGKSDTVGFSAISAVRLGYAVDLYNFSGYGTPNEYAIHIGTDAASMIPQVGNVLDSKGEVWKPVRISEAPYDDAAVAYDARSAIIQSSFQHVVPFLIQWPDNSGVTYTPPVSFFYWAAYGF